MGYCGTTNANAACKGCGILYASLVAGDQKAVFNGAGYSLQTQADRTTCYDLFEGQSCTPGQLTWGGAYSCHLSCFCLGPMQARTFACLP